MHDTNSKFINRSIFSYYIYIKISIITINYCTPKVESLKKMDGEGGWSKFCFGSDGSI